MYWKRLGKVVTFLDILLLGLIAFLVIISLIVTVLEVLPQELDVTKLLLALTKSLISISPVWGAVSVIALAWIRHSDGLRTRLEYCNEKINKPLLVDLFMDDAKEYLFGHSILYNVSHGYSTTYEDGDTLLIDIKDENELRERIANLRSQRLMDLDRFVFRLVRNSGLYPQSLRKRIQTLPNELDHYNYQIALLAFQIFKKAQSLGVKGNEQLTEREALIRFEKIVLSKVKLRDSEHIDHLIENLYGKQIQATIDSLKKEVDKLRNMKEKLCSNLQRIKTEMEEYIEEMLMEYPQGYLRKSLGRYSVALG